MVDFTGGELPSLAADQPLEAVIHVGPNAGLVEQQLSKNWRNGQWRLVFEIVLNQEVSPGSGEAVELRAFLKKGKDVLTETWSYVYLP